MCVATVRKHSVQRSCCGGPRSHLHKEDLVTAHCLVLAWKSPQNKASESTISVRGIGRWGFHGALRWKAVLDVRPLIPIPLLMNPMQRALAWMKKCHKGDSFHLIRSVAPALFLNFFSVSILKKRSNSFCIERKMCRVWIEWHRRCFCVALFLMGFTVFLYLQNTKLCLAK